MAVFTVAGFGHAFKQMGLEAAAERTGKILVCKHGEEMAHLDPPHRVRRVLEILGPTFIKLGQILAPRPDLFGQEWIAEFERLQAQAPPVDFETLRRQIEKDLGAPLDETRNALPAPAPETRPVAARRPRCVEVFAARRAPV